MSSSAYMPYHAGESYVALRRDLNWDSLRTHARNVVLKCMNEEQQPNGDNEISRALPKDLPSEPSSRFYAFLHRVACAATPATAAVDYSLTCDRCFAGGRLLAYRHRTFFIIGGASAADVPRLTHTSYWLRGREGGEELADEDGKLIKVGKSQAWAGDLPDGSRIHEAAELRPLVSPIRLLIGSVCGAAFSGAGGAAATSSRRLLVRTAAPPSASSCYLPPLEGCAVATYGRCILVHGGKSPNGEATAELRGFALEPDARRPGEYGMHGRLRVEQKSSSGSGNSRTGEVTSKATAWWLPATTTTDVGASAAVATANAAGGGSSASRPCPPPSARHGHHMAVDGVTSRLWMYGGRCGRTGRCSGIIGGGSTGDVSGWPLPALRTPVDDGEQVPADMLPCCFWAQLPAATAAATASLGCDDIPGCSEDGSFPGGGVVVRQVEWHCLPLRPSQSGGGFSDGGGGAGGVGSGGGGGGRALTLPLIPDPTRVAAIAIHNGGLYVLSSGLGPSSVSVRPKASMGLRDREHRWWLHRIHLQTGECELLGNAITSTTTMALAAATMAGGASKAAAAALEPPPPPPLYHDDAVAMADDTLPYIYVYGSRQRSSGPTALHGGVFVPSLHRISLAATAAAAAGRWEAVELLGTARLYPARGALGFASGGTVTLVGGIRDGRLGVESRVQLVVAAIPQSKRLDRHDHGAAALARCRRVVVERLRRVAPREVRFAKPNATSRSCSSGGSGAGGSGVAPVAAVMATAASRPCSALAAALSLYSRGGLFDDFFELLDDGDDDGDDDDGGGRGGGSCSGNGGGMTIPGHDQLAVAAAVAWVMGRTHVRSDWEPRFLLQVFRVAHCWEVVALQREIAALVTRVAPLLPLEEVPAALMLWDELRRLRAVGMISPLPLSSAPAPSPSPSATGAGGGGGARGGLGSGGTDGVDEGAKVAADLRSRLQRAATSGEVHIGNIEGVMAAVLAASREAHDAVLLHAFRTLRQTCIKVAEKSLAVTTPSSPSNSNSNDNNNNDGGGNGDDRAGRSSRSSSSRSTTNAYDTKDEVEDARAATRFACRFGVQSVLFRAMHWWRCRLLAFTSTLMATGCSCSTGRGCVARLLDHLLELLSELQDFERAEGAEEQEVEEEEEESRVKKRPRDPPLPASRSSSSVPLLATSAGAGGVPQETQQQRDPFSGDDGGSGADSNLGAVKRPRHLLLPQPQGGASSLDPADVLVEVVRPTVEATEQPGLVPPPLKSPPSVPLSSSPSIPGQVRGFLWGQLLHSVRPHSALEILQALDRCPPPAAAAAAAKKTTGVECQVRQFVRQQAFRKLTELPPAQRLQLPPPFRTPGYLEHDTLRREEAAKIDGRLWAPAAVEVVRLLRGGQSLSRACDDWQRVQQERVAGRTTAASTKSLLAIGAHVDERR